MSSDVWSRIASAYNVDVEIERSVEGNFLDLFPAFIAHKGRLVRVHRHAALTSAFSAAARLYLKDGAKVDVSKTPDALELNDFEELFDEKPQELASRITAPPDSSI